MLKWLTSLLGETNEKKLKKIQPLVLAVNDLEEAIKQLNDGALAAKTAEFRTRLQQGETEDDLLPEAFAVVREVAWRTLQMRHFDVQILGGVVLHQGAITEMKTGEGKTLVATLPAYLNALSGHGVHIITVNDYLAARDAEWMGPVYEFLGLTVGAILSNQDYRTKKQAYACDITYGTNNEFGFDYLRDNMATHVDQCVQRKLHYAIVDEVDSILIDEARTPLIISGQVEGSVNKYPKIYKVARQLQREEDYIADDKQKNIALTEDGITKTEKMLGVESLFDMNNMDTAHILTQCLKAIEHFQRDVDYMIKDQEIVIVDEFTGRLMTGRRYSDGLHQAIEAKENVPIRDENQTLASITFQNYFRMYAKLAGMTGTAVTEANEFAKIYGLDVLEIPTNKPCVRQDLSDVVYKSRQEKFNAVIENIIALHHQKAPVLVGTIAIETSELLSTLLKRRGIPHHVLNARYHEREAEIIAQAGQAGAVTIATNMAGRGTDIVLGTGVTAVGGLHIIGTERHESRRIDNQLRGRAGRQGDPGGTRFYISLEDDLMRLFGSDRIRRMMETMGLPENTPIEHPLITRSIEKAQYKVEQYYFGIRKQVLQYDDVMNRQRHTLYAMRRQILEGQNIPQRLVEMLTATAKVISNSAFIADEQGHFEPLSSLELGLREVLNPQAYFNQDEILKAVNPKLADDLRSGVINETDQAELQASLLTILEHRVKQRAQEITPELFNELGRIMMLRNIDSKWMDHLYNLDALREGIGLRAYGQKDPLIEYKVEGFQMFKEMLDSVAEESIKMLFRVQIMPQENKDSLEDEWLEPRATNLRLSGAEQVLAPKRRAQEKVGRNESCPCGSGKKYKKCCGLS